MSELPRTLMEAAALVMTKIHRGRLLGRDVAAAARA